MIILLADFTCPFSPLRLCNFSDTIMTPEHIKQFEVGRIATTAVRLLGCAVDDNWEASREDQSIVIAYLMVKINLLNGHRTGVFSNMMLKEVELAKLDGKTGRWIILVRKQPRKYHFIICSSVLYP